MPGKRTTGSAKPRMISAPAVHLWFPAIWGNALFFCQQAAEKSLKAFLTFHDRTLRRTHDIEQLGETCCLIDGTLASLLEEADVLSEYA